MFKVRNKRETGFEILRIMAIFLICIVHILNHGGMLNNANPNTIVWHKLLYSLFTPAVNVFVLISAYFMVDSKLKHKKLIKLWLQVVFYCSISYLIVSLFIDNNFSKHELLKCFFPIVKNQRWFFTSYFVLMLFSPFLNKILKNSTKTELYSLSILLFILSFLYMKQPFKEMYNLNNGYSIFWFISLYIFAGTLKIHPLNIKKRYALIIYILSTLLTWFFNTTSINNRLFNLISSSFDYTAPLTIISSISLLILFKNINIKNTVVHNSICYIASLTFGIYLAEGCYLWNFWHFNLFKIPSYYKSPISPIYVLLIALAIFTLCAIIEALRKLLVFITLKVIDSVKQRNKNNS